MASATATRRLLSSFLNPNSSTIPPESPFTLNSKFIAIIALLFILICSIAIVRWTCSHFIIINNNNTTQSTNHYSIKSGLKKKILNSFPKFILDSNKRDEFCIDECCVICLGEFVDGEVIRVLPQCGHGFHAECVDTWLARRASCPSCRLILDNSKCVKCSQLPTSVNMSMASTHAW